MIFFSRTVTFFNSVALSNMVQFSHQLLLSVCKQTKYFPTHLMTVSSKNKLCRAGFTAACKAPSTSIKVSFHFQCN